MVDSVRGRRWRVQAEMTPGRAGVGSYPPLIVHLLRLRGVRSTGEARTFLTGGGEPADAAALAGMEQAVSRIRAAISGHHRIAVYGDYDVDGVTATAILSEGLRGLGGDVVTHLPNRFTNGYGLTRAALKTVRELGAELVITVDCGINANAEVEYAAELGLEVIIIDHHEPPPVLPDAAAIVDPKLGGGPAEFDGLASCGLAFTTLRALYDAAGEAFDGSPYLDLAALGTVADMVPLTGENRRIVREGLRAFRTTRRPGVLALMASAAVDAAAVNAQAIGFRLAPRINAAGRLADAAIALELLTTRDQARALALAAELNDLNSRRQQMTTDAMIIARRLAEEECAGAPLIMVGHEQIAQGIVGLVAGRLAEEHHRPTIVYQRHDDICVGSVRGIPEFNVVDCLAQGDGLMERWGGHAQAGGFTVRTEAVTRLRHVLSDWTDIQLRGVDLRPELTADTEIALSAVTVADLQMLASFEPCGQANATPVMISRNVAVMRSRTMGSGGKHLRMDLRDGPRVWPAVAWEMGHAAPAPGRRIDVIYSIGPDRNNRPELTIKDFAVMG